MIKTYFFVTVLVSILSYAVLNYDQLRDILNGLFVGKDYQSNLDRLFSKEELSTFIDDPLYLAILGKVFDVSKGRKHYGKGQGYNGFVGRDGSKAFITGDFTEEGLTDDISSLSPADLCSLNDWVKLYEKDYVYKGKLIGRFYDQDGSNTPFLNEVFTKIELGELEKKASQSLELKYPPCNAEWDQERGTRIWCSTQSGGIKRNWVGYPRKFFQPGKKGFRCACVKNLDKSSAHQSRHGNFEFYENCKVDSTSCNIPTN